MKPKTDSARAWKGLNNGIMRKVLSKSSKVLSKGSKELSKGSNEAKSVGKEFNDPESVEQQFNETGSVNQSNDCILEDSSIEGVPIGSDLIGGIP